VAGQLQCPVAVDFYCFGFEIRNGGAGASIWERKGSGPNGACPTVKKRWPTAGKRQWHAALRTATAAPKSVKGGRRPVGLG
jgi:hypothetical protein